MKKTIGKFNIRLNKIFIILLLQLVIYVQYAVVTPAQAAETAPIAKNDKTSLHNILSVADLPSGKLLLAGQFIRTNSLKDTLYIYPNSSRRFVVQLTNVPAVVSLLKDKNNVLLEVLISTSSQVGFAKFISLKGMATHNDLYKNAITILQ